MWTQAWRRLNKKSRDDGAIKKRTRKAVKVQRAIVGASLEDLMKKKQATKPKSAATDAALKYVYSWLLCCYLWLFTYKFFYYNREVKERAKAAKKANTAVRTAGSANIPKNQKFAAGTKGAGRR